MRVLVTGAAGFIGSTLAKKLLDRGDQVVGIDNLNDYYDVSLKEARLGRLTEKTTFQFMQMDIADRAALANLFEESAFDVVVNLAAQAGVRYSIENPAAYIDANLVGFGNILEGCRHSGVGHLVYASSSSVYGSNEDLPFSEKDNVDHPISLYAASKKANELMAHAYAHLYGLPTTGLRFFTVYGPWGRPDMALFKFTRGILDGTPIPVFNKGQMVRDFTYIDDIVEGVMRVIDRPAAKSEGRSEPDRSRSMAGLQHWQQSSGAADGLHIRFRKSARAEGGAGLDADAGWRCTGNGSRCERPGRGLQLPSARAGRRGNREIR